LTPEANCKLNQDRIYNVISAKYSWRVDTVCGLIVHAADNNEEKEVAPGSD